VAARRGDRPSAGAKRAKRPDAVEQATSELYALPPEEFVKARDTRARELKADGKRDEADAVRKLRKPTLAAWAVNQLARERELDVRRLLKAGERLQEGGADASDFAAARQEESDVIRRLLRGAREVLEAAGHKPSDSMLESVSSMLRSAAVDEQGRTLLAEGRVTQELEPGGFELFSALLESARPAPRRGAKAKRSAPDRAAERRRQRAAEQKAAEAAAEADEIERELVREEQRVTDAERALREAERNAKALRVKAKRARERAERARARADSLKDTS
jgi:hypothetical protein